MHRNGSRHGDPQKAMPWGPVQHYSTILRRNTQPVCFKLTSVKVDCNDPWPAPAIAGRLNFVNLPKCCAAESVGKGCKVTFRRNYPIPPTQPKGSFASLPVHSWHLASESVVDDGKANANGLARSHLGLQPRTSLMGPHILKASDCVNHA